LIGYPSGFLTWLCTHPPEPQIGSDCDSTYAAIYQ